MLFGILEIFVAAGHINGIKHFGTNKSQRTLIIFLLLHHTLLDRIQKIFWRFPYPNTTGVLMHPTQFQLHGIAYEKVPQRFLELPHYFAITEKSGNLKEAAEKLFLMGEPRFLQDSKAQSYDINHKLWLAGGITPENAAELVTRFQPELIDISSGVEDTDNPGIKNHNKIRVILNLFQDL